MRTPVFLSVGGKDDAEFARKVHQHLGESLAYHYQVTGEETIEFRKEIEAKIGECQLFVVFWSHSYLASEHACNELAYFKKLNEDDGNSDKQIIVVPRKVDEPLIQSKWKNPITQREGEFALGRWRNERAIEVGADPIRIAQFILRKLHHLKVLDDVLIPRGWLIDHFKNEISQPDYRARELVFVTGLEGHGRRTALRQFMLQLFPHRVDRSIPLDSIDEPDDLLIRLMEVAALSAKARAEIFDNIKSGESNPIKEVRKILHQARQNKSYYIIAVDRFVGIDAATLPKWLSDVLSVFQVGPAPLVFVVTSSPVNDAMLQYYPTAGRVRVPGVEEGEMNELVHRLAQEDPTPERWTDAKKRSVANAAGSSPALCKSIMRKMAAEQTLDFVDEIARRAEDSFGQALAGLMSHWLQAYGNKKSDLVALRVIEKLGVVSKDALDEILRPITHSHGPIDLYSMRDQGLVEQLSDGVYRIPPLIQRRLGAALWGRISPSEVDRLFESFSKKTLVAKSEFGAIYASNAAAISARTGASDVAPEYEQYLTIATLFKAGLDRYSNKEWKLANQILQRTMTRLINNNVSVDLNTQVEIARFSGLAAARRKEQHFVERACSYLETKLSTTRRAKSAKAMAKFVRGFKHRIAHQYPLAIEEFRLALRILENERSVERQRAAVYTELATAHLRISPPQFEDALKMARAALDEKNVTHTLNAFVQALVLFLFRSGRFNNESQIFDLEVELDANLTDLEKRSIDNGQTFHIDRRAEYRRERDVWVRRISKSREVEGALLDANTTFEPVEVEYL